MDRRNFNQTLKYTPKTWSFMLYFLLLILVFLLFYGRKTESLRVEYFMKIWPGFYQNISNFSLSYLLYTGIGFFWLMAGISTKHILYLGLTLIALNLIYELFIPVLNTPDIVDAWFGIVGSFLGGIFLFFIHRYGLKPNPEN